MKKYKSLQLIIAVIVLTFIGCGENENKIKKVCNGKGTIEYTNAIYKGECKNGKEDGKGILTWNSGSKYDGEWKDGEKEGKGVMEYSSGSKYNGEWKDDKKEGKGVMEYSSGSKYDGEWKDGKKEGKGKYITQYGIYSGIWENGSLEEVTNQNSYEEAYQYFNKIRGIAGMIKLEPNGILQESSQNHSNYIQLHNEELEGLAYHNEEKNKDGFTGIHAYNRAISEGYFSTNVGEGISHKNTAIISINSLMTAIYHRFDILTFSKNEVGVGFTQESDSMVRKFVHNIGNSKLNDLCDSHHIIEESYYKRVCADEERKIPSSLYIKAKNDIKKLNPKYVLWPADESINNLYRFGGETPDPMPDYNETGNPISIQFNDFYFTEKITMKSFKLYLDNKEIKETRILTEKTDPNQHFNNYQYALFPLKVLEKNRVYKVSFKYEYRGIAKEINWSFETME